MLATAESIPAARLAAIADEIGQRLLGVKNAPSSTDNGDSAHDVWGIAVVLYRPGSQRLIVVRRRRSGVAHLTESVCRAVLGHARYPEFESDSARTVGLQVDFLLEEPRPVAFADLKESDLGADRFEFGVDGLRIEGATKTQYFLPGDAFVKSVLGLSQLQQTIARMFPGEDWGSLKMARFRSRSFLRTGERWLPLFRGLPMQGEEVTVEDLWGRVQAAVQRVVRTQGADGRFEYYYDAKTDTQVNHEHPTRNPRTNPFYNFVRHCGGVLTLLFHEAARRDERLRRVLPSRGGECPTDARAIQVAIECYLKTLVGYVTASGLVAAYAVDNNKGKLGGSGLGLYSLSLYQQLFGDDRYSEAAQRLANHITAEIQDSGEFRYYHTYLGRQVMLSENSQLFSFYYPGEGIAGLAAYLKHVCRSDAERVGICERLHRALRFLIFERPQKYPQHFAPLPSDSWLMMGIHELWGFAEFQRPEYLQFVFTDADAMCDHQYTPQNSLFPDYIGSFYYQYGEHPYPDGARAEGLTAAYMLAVLTGDAVRQRRYFQCLVRAAWACLHLCNTRESLYSVPNPDHALGSIRFKFTRQWVRVDTTEHVASFFLRFLPYFMAESWGRFSTCPE